MTSSWHKKVNFFLIIIILAVYPFSLKLCNAAILIFAVHWLTWLIRKPSDFSWSNKLMWLFVAFFMLTAASVLYSENVSVAIFALDKKISLLIFPLVLGTSPPISSYRFDRLMVIAVSSTSLAILFCLSAAFFRMVSGVEGGFFWKDLTAPLNEFHPTYLSLYINFHIGWLLIYFFEKRKFLTHGNTILIFGVIAFFYLSLALLSSKIHLLLSVCVPFIAAFCRLSKRSLLRIIPLFIAVVCIFALILKDIKTWERFKHIHNFSYRLDAPVNTFNEFTIRLAIAECSWIIIRNNMAFGVGIGDVYDELDKVYRAVEYKFGYLDQQNPHNEYLSQWLATGMVGLVLMLGILFLLFKRAIKDKRYDFLILLILFAVTFAIESLLERQKGIVLFSLLTSLYVFTPAKENLSQEVTVTKKTTSQ